MERVTRLMQFVAWVVLLLIGLVVLHNAWTHRNPARITVYVCGGDVDNFGCVPSSSAPPSPIRT